MSTRIYFLNGSKVSAAGIWIAQATKAIVTLYTVGLLLSVTGAVTFFGSQMTKAMTTGLRQFIANPTEALESISAPVSRYPSKRNSQTDLRSVRRTTSVSF